MGLSLDQAQGVYSGWPDVDGSSQLRLCHTCIINVMLVRGGSADATLGSWPSGEAAACERGASVLVVESLGWGVAEAWVSAAAFIRVAICFLDH